MEIVFSIPSTNKQMKWEYVQYDKDYDLILWIEMGREINPNVFREWNERMKRLEGLVPPIKQILLNVLRNEKKYCGMVSGESYIIVSSCLIHSHSHSHHIHLSLFLISSRCWAHSQRRRKCIRSLSNPLLLLMLHNSSHKLKQSGIKDMN